MYVPSSREREIANNAFMAGVVAQRMDDEGLLGINGELEDVIETVIALATGYRKDPSKSEYEQLNEFVSFVGDEFLNRYGAAMALA